MGVASLRKHVIELPKRVVVGEGILEEVPRYISELDLGRRVVLLSGPSATRSIALRVRQSLEDRHFEVCEFIVENASIETVRRVLDYAKECKPELVVGVGGGKVIDVAKFLARDLGVALVSIPTAPSHDGICSPFASIKGLDRPTSVKCVMPTLVVADIDVISLAPRRLILAGCGDLIGKLTAVLDWRLAHRLRGEYYGEYAASLALLSAKHVLRLYEEFSAKTIPREAVRTLVEALISSGVAMGIAGSTRPASGSEHMFAHALDIVANYPALHGEEVALGTIMMLYLHGKNWKRIKRILMKMGLPTTAKELGVKDYQIVEALTRAHEIRPERYTILGERGLTWDAAEKLARKTGVID